MRTLSPTTFLTLVTIAGTALFGQPPAAVKGQPPAAQSKGVAAAPLNVPIVAEVRGLAPGRYPLKDSKGTVLGEFTINPNGTMDIGKLFSQKAGGGETACNGSLTEEEIRKMIREQDEKDRKAIEDILKQPRPDPKDKGPVGLLRAYCGAALRAPSPGSTPQQAVQK